jgi:hypothetical protein
MRMPAEPKIPFHLEGSTHPFVTLCLVACCNGERSGLGGQLLAFASPSCRRFVRLLSLRLEKGSRTVLA